MLVKSSSEIWKSKTRIKSQAGKDMKRVTSVPIEISAASLTSDSISSGKTVDKSALRRLCGNPSATAEINQKTKRKKKEKKK